MLNFKINLKNIMNIHLNPRNKGLKAVIFASFLLSKDSILKITKSNFIEFVNSFYDLTGKELDEKLTQMSKYGIIIK